MKYLKPGEIRCWSCHRWMSNNEFQNSDGYCVHCDTPIDVMDEPYINVQDLGNDELMGGRDEHTAPGCLCSKSI